MDSKNDNEALSLKSKTKPKLAIITTGGTIAEKYDFKNSIINQALTGEELVSEIPELKPIANYQVTEVYNSDSKDISCEMWLKLAKEIQKSLDDESIDGVIITHGTDTMEDTAYFLNYTLKFNNKPVIITGAMHNASAKYIKDGPSNIIASVRVATHSKVDNYCNCVMAVMNGKIISAESLYKINTSNIAAFSGGESGYLGIIDFENIIWLNQALSHYTFDLPESFPRVDIITLSPGDDGSLIEAAVKLGAEGIVIVGYGTGNVSSDVYDRLLKVLDNNKDLIFAISSRALYGATVTKYGCNGNARSLNKQGGILTGMQSPWKTKILLMLGIANKMKRDEIQRAIFDVD